MTTAQKIAYEYCHRTEEYESCAADIDQAIAEAVAAEREACAKIAESFYFDDVLPGGGDELVSEAGNEIAAAIRARKETAV